MTSCRTSVPRAAEALGQFAAHLRGLELHEIQELYSSTFDLTPACAPYLSVHLFGEDSFKRAHLMTGLRECYAATGVPCEHELPDHLAIVLQALEHLAFDVRHDLLQLCLVRALTKMRAELARQANPYVHAIGGLEYCAAAWAAEPEVCHA
jgi:nitrate reductase delta subunit